MWLCVVGKQAFQSSDANAVGSKFVDVRNGDVLAIKAQNAFCMAVTGLLRKRHDFGIWGGWRVLEGTVVLCPRHRRCDESKLVRGD
jgi:hypothetical protein